MNVFHSLFSSNTYVYNFFFIFNNLFIITTLFLLSFFNTVFLKHIYLGNSIDFTEKIMPLQRSGKSSSPPDSPKKRTYLLSYITSQ